MAEHARQTESALVSCSRYGCQIFPTVSEANQTHTVEGGILVEGLRFGM